MAVDAPELARRLDRLGRENEQLIRRLVASERRFRGIGKAVWKVQEEERRRLARELHDGIGQTLTALKMQLELIAAKAARDPEAAAGRLAESIEIAGSALEEVRRVSHQLRPQVLDDLGLGPALTWLARTLGNWTGFEVALEVAGIDEPRLDPDLEILIFRCVQELLTNAMKHSGTDRAEVMIARRGPLLSLRVRDRGRGFDPAALRADDTSRGSGLGGLETRVQMFGGRCRCHSVPGEGTTVEIALPLTEGMP